MLTGSVPSELAKLSKLYWLNLWGNKLVGNMNPTLCEPLYESKRQFAWFVDCQGSAPQVVCDCCDC